MAIDNHLRDHIIKRVPTLPLFIFGHDSCSYELMRGISGELSCDVKRVVGIILGRDEIDVSSLLAYSTKKPRDIHRILLYHTLTHTDP